jgi:hypothetical protein
MRAGISDFLHYLLTPGARAPRSRRRPERSRRCRPTVELLETRATPSVTTNNRPPDLQINLTGGDTLSVSVNDIPKLDVVGDGQNLEVQSAPSSLVSITINAANGAADSIDLSGLGNNFAALSQLKTITVNIDRADTVNRGSGWVPAGSEVVGGQRFQDFTEGGVTLRITDFTPLTPPERPIQATLVRRKGKLLLQVFFADTGLLKEQLRCPFQPGKFKGSSVSVVDNNGDGVPETVVLSALRHGHPVMLEFPG